MIVKDLLGNVGEFLSTHSIITDVIGVPGKKELKIKLVVIILFDTVQDVIIGIGVNE